MPFDCKQKPRRATTTLADVSQMLWRTRALVGILFLALLQHPGRTFSAPLPDPYSLNLAWDSSPSPEAIGYKLYYGAVSGDYTNSIATGNVMSLTIPSLPSGVTYYFAITAVGADGLESDYSNEIGYTQAPPSMRLHAVPGGQFMLTVAGSTAHTYDIETTPDFTAWTVIGTVTVGSGGSLDFSDPDTADFPQRFYRTRDTQP